MEIVKIHQHQDSESSTNENMENYYTHERTSHHTSFFYRFSNLSSSSSALSPRFLGLCILVFVYYIGYGYLQELMFTLKGFDNTAWFLTCYQFFVYAILSFIHLGFAGLDQRRASYRSYILLAALTVTTMGLSNYAVAYLNYPTQVMFKCCKLIPVLIGGILIQKKTFNRYDVAAAFCMSTGLVFFTLADSKVQPNFNLYGVIIICSALIADAAIGNYQEKIMKEHHVPNVEIVFYSFIFGFVFVLIGLIVTNNFFSSLEFWNKHPFPTYGYGLIFSIFGYLGIDIVLTLIKEYGALICVTVTTCRKAITIILSFTLFSKPFVFDYVWSGLIVIIGIYLNVYSRNQTAFNAKIVSIANSVFHSRLWPSIITPPTIRTLSV
jgi:adenosine 3'-phospho 5'-phosphosulfate transporter B3